jgi:hypothetical protein
MIKQYKTSTFSIQHDEEQEAKKIAEAKKIDDEKKIEEKKKEIKPVEEKKEEKPVEQSTAPKFQNKL